MRSTCGKSSVPAFHSRVGIVENGLCYVGETLRRVAVNTVLFMSNVIDVITRFLVVCLRLVSPVKEAWQSEHLSL